MRTQIPSSKTSSESSSVTLLPVAAFVASVKRLPSPPASVTSALPLISMPSSRNAPVSPRHGFPLSPEQKGHALSSTANLTEPPATAQLSFIVGWITPLCKKTNVDTTRSDEPSNVVRKSMASAGTPNSDVRRAVSLTEKSTLANVCRLCLPALGPVLPMIDPAAFSSYRLSMATVTWLSPLLRVILPDCPSTSTVTPPGCRAPGGGEGGGDGGADGGGGVEGGGVLGGVDGGHDGGNKGIGEDGGIDGSSPLPNSVPLPNSLELASASDDWHAAMRRTR
mmetsp:Transcript_43327/g.113884  ORF Transcript_43327/g.113884 Transcript_43327/m.113884 type:complete len:280 (-) Transcript_43327:83-922(-)